MKTLSMSIVVFTFLATGCAHKPLRQRCDEYCQNQDMVCAGVSSGSNVYNFSTGSLSRGSATYQCKVQDVATPGTPQE